MEKPLKRKFPFEIIIYQIIAQWRGKGVKPMIEPLSGTSDPIRKPDSL